MKTTFFVEYNGKFVATYKSVRACLNFISRKGYTNDLDNTVRVVDTHGNLYNLMTGEIKKYKKY